MITDTLVILLLSTERWVGQKSETLEMDGILIIMYNPHAQAIKINKRFSIKFKVFKLQLMQLCLTYNSECDLFLYIHAKLVGGYDLYCYVQIINIRTCY